MGFVVLKNFCTTLWTSAKDIKLHVSVLLMLWQKSKLSQMDETQSEQSIELHEIKHVFVKSQGEMPRFPVEETKILLKELDSNFRQNDVSSCFDIGGIIILCLHFLKCRGRFASLRCSAVQKISTEIIVLDKESSQVCPGCKLGSRGKSPPRFSLSLQTVLRPDFHGPIPKRSFCMFMLCPLGKTKSSDVICHLLALWREWCSTHSGMKGEGHLAARARDQQRGGCSTRAGRGRGLWPGWQGRALPSPIAILLKLLSWWKSRTPSNQEKQE